MTDCAASQKDVALDALRGIAALTVVLSHSFFGFFPYTHTGAPSQLRYNWELWAFNSPFYFLYSGGFAVSLFFVLSGYVLSKKFFAGADIEYIRSAALKRYVRLGIPVFASVMIGYVLMACKSFPSIPDSLPRSFAWDFYHERSNFLEALGQGVYGSLLYGQTKYNYVLWTIQIEFYGSLFLFAFLALFGKIRFGSVIAAATVLLLANIFREQGMYFAMFIIGAYINRTPSIFRHSRLIPPMLLLGLFISSYKANAPIFIPLAATANKFQALTGIILNWPVVYEAIAAWLIVNSIIGSSTAHKLLSGKIMKWAGKISFSVYLIHTLILGCVGASIYKHTVSTLGYESAAFVSIATVFFFTLLLAEPFRRSFDTTAIRLANMIGKPS